MSKQIIKIRTLIRKFSLHHFAIHIITQVMGNNCKTRRLDFAQRKVNIELEIWVCNNVSFL